MGHEAVGRIVESVDATCAPNTRVVIEPNLPCGACAICRRGHGNVWLATGHQMAGLKTATGSGLLLAQLMTGETPRFDPEPYRSRNAAEVRDFAASDFLEARKVKRLDRFSQFSIASARLALEDAGIDMKQEDGERVGSMMGSALGGIRYAEDQLGVFAGKRFEHDR